MKDIDLNFNGIAFSTVGFSLVPTMLAQIGKRASINKLRSALMLATAEAKRLAPVRTGALKQSIRFEIDYENLVGWYGSDLPYAYFVEVGTVNMAGRHYLEGALNVLKVA